MKTLFTLSFLSCVVLTGAYAQRNILIENHFDGYNGLITTVAPGWYYSWNDSVSSSRSFYNTAPTSGDTIPAYKFGKDSVTVVSPAFANADSVSFFLKGNGLARDTNTFYVYSSPDSMTWTEIAALDSIGGAVRRISLALSSSDMYLKFYYRKYLSGFNVGLDDILVFNSLVGIKPPSRKHSVSVYPNPSKGMLSVDPGTGSLKNIFISVNDLPGNELKRIQVKNSESAYQLDLSEFQDGIYFVRIKSDAGETVQRVILKK